ncbi:putative dentin sialophosphoprotein-like [Alternaria alternata]|nr:putative dentin sialophosphoprotein-like [Alternaria alternata]
MLVEDDSDDEESVLLAVDDEILLNGELESLDVGITLLDDPDPVLLVEVVGMLLDEPNEVLVNEALELLSGADDVLLLELSEEELLLMELEVSDELEEELLERLSEEVAEDNELVGVVLDGNEVLEVVGNSTVDELPELEDAVVSAVEIEVEELKELKVVGVLEELLDSVGEDEELLVLDDDVVGLEEELSVLADDVAELEEELPVLVDDNVLEITLLVTLLDNEEDMCVLDEIGELAEDEGVNTGQDVPVVEILVMVVVAVLATVCDI